MTSLLVHDDRLEEVNIKRGMFQRASVSTLLIVIVQIPLSMILNKSGHGYQTSESSVRLSHPL